jgi:hypothetical protein
VLIGDLRNLSDAGAPPLELPWDGSPKPTKEKSLMVTVRQAQVEEEEPGTLLS